MACLVADLRAVWRGRPPVWQSRGDIPFPTDAGDLLIYAYNIWLVGSELPELLQRAGDIDRWLQNRDLKLGADSLQLLRGAAADPVAASETERTLPFSGIMREVDTMDVLGVRLDKEATVERMVDHRLQKAKGVAFKHRGRLHDPALTPENRAKHWAQTVGAATLWGSSVWIPSEMVRTKLEAFQTKTTPGNHLRRPPTRWHESCLQA